MRVQFVSISKALQIIIGCQGYAFEVIKVFTSESVKGNLQLAQGAGHHSFTPISPKLIFTSSFLILINPLSRLIFSVFITLESETCQFAREVALDFSRNYRTLPAIARSAAIYFFQIENSIPTAKLAVPTLLSKGQCAKCMSRSRGPSYDRSSSPPQSRLIQYSAVVPEGGCEAKFRCRTQSQLLLINFLPNLFWSSVCV